MRRSQWQRSLLPADAKLQPGQRILVREAFTLTAPIDALKWDQRVPPNCFFAAKPESRPQTLGTLKPLRADELNFQARGLAPGNHEHEYELVVGRPGVCLLPLPEISVAGRRLEVSGQPEELRLNVIGPAEPVSGS